MSYKVLNKAPKINDGQVVSTIIDVKQGEPYTIFSRELDGDHTKSTDNKLIELVLEVVNEETTPKSELKNNIKELRKQVSEQNEIIQQALESNGLLSNAFEELSIVVLNEILPQLEEKEIIPGIPIEDIAKENDDIIPGTPIEDIAGKNNDIIPATPIEDIAQPIGQEDEETDEPTDKGAD